MERLPPRRPTQGRSLFVALFVAVTWAASTFAVAGILAVALDRDPVQTPTPPYVGLIGLAVAGVVVWLAVGLTVRATTPWVGTIAAAAAVYLTIVVTALLGSFRLFVEQAISPFVIVAALLGALAVVVTWFALRRPPGASPPNAGLSEPPRHS
jgi:drug/metabolite transporter (DMT)-like permease